jgi:hypothetical protein
MPVSIRKPLRSVEPTGWCHAPKAGHGGLINKANGLKVGKCSGAVNINLSEREPGKADIREAVEFVDLM